MRVLHFLDSLGRGGAEMQALDVCRNAADFGLEMTIVSAGGGALEADFRNSGAEYIRLDRKLPVDLRLAWRIRRIVKERDIQVVHGYQAVDGLHLYLATFGNKNVRKVLSFQGFIQDRQNRAVSRFLIPRMDANIVVSEGLKYHLATSDKLDTSGRFFVVYNGADPERLRPRGGSLKKEIGLSVETSIIGMVGNFYRDLRKDQLTLCKALPTVFENFPNAHCIFAGRIEEGAEEKFAKCVRSVRENKIEDRVHFLGVRNDIPDILSELDIFAFSSLHEGMPVAVSEAMLAGVPAVLSDIQPHIEISDDGKYAEIFPIKDDKVLAAKISKLLDNKEYRDSLALNAKEFAEANFSISAHLNALCKLYRSFGVED